MKKIVIIGNSGAARECYWLLQEVLSTDQNNKDSYLFHGFLSWKNYFGELKELKKYSLGDADEYCISKDDLFVIGIGDVALRKTVFEEFKNKNAIFMNLIHPNVYICPSAQIGEANIIQRDSTIYCNATLGNANYLNGAINLAHDSIVGDYNTIGSYSMILGKAILGSCNHLSPRTMLLDKTKAGNNNHFAPASILYKGCKDNAIMAGNPALKIGEKSPTEKK